MPLSQQICTACHADASAVTKAERVELLSQIPQWTAISDNGVNKLERVYSCKNFVEALRFANAVGQLAEEHGHHPQLIVEWGKVKVVWWTHKIGDLHLNDFILAAKTDELS